MAFLKSPPVYELHAVLWNSCEYNLTHIVRLTLYPAIILHLHPASAGPGQRANVGQSTDCCGEPSSLQLPPLGPQKPFMFVYDLKGKYAPAAVYMYCRPAAHIML